MSHDDAWGHRIESWAAFFLIVFGIACVGAMAFLPERAWGTEEGTALVASYTLAHNGELAFPTYAYEGHAQYHHLFVHPPTHYLIVGLLMKAGFSLYYAEAVPLFVLSGLCLVLIWKARYPPAVTLGLLAGFVTGLGWLATTGNGDYSFNLRPDAHMAVAAIGGLLMLESARARFWDVRWLFAGAFLLVYASTVHYSGLLAWLGIGVYVLLILRELGGRKAKGKFCAIAVGGSLAGLPYIFLHILPNWENLKQYSTYGPSRQTLLEIIKGNFALYTGLAQQAQNWPLPKMVWALPINLLSNWLIPPFLIALLLLLIPKSTRILALASLPLPLFLFFIFRRKLAAYLDFECILLLMASWVILARLWFWAGRALPENWKRIQPAIFAWLFAAVFSTTTPALRGLEWDSKPRYHEMVLARAAAKQVVGPDAAITSIHALWYIAGASKWYDLTHDLLWGPVPQNPREFWSRFDGIAALNLAFFGNQTGQNEASLYEQGIVHLYGFESLKIAKDRRWVWLTAREKGPVTGFFWKQDQFYRFTQSADGDYTVVSVILACPLAEIGGLAQKAGAIEYWALELPKKPEETQRYAYFMLFDSGGYHGLPSGFKAREEIRGRAQPENIAVLLKNFDERKDSIEFEESYPEFLRHYVKKIDAKRPSLIWTPEGPATALDKRATTDTFDAKLDGWQPLATTEPQLLEPNTWYLASFDLKLDRGQITINLKREGVEMPLVRLYREDSQDKRENIVFRTPAEPGKIDLEIAANNGNRRREVRFSVRAASIERVELTR